MLIHNKRISVDDEYSLEMSHPSSTQSIEDYLHAAQCNSYARHFLA